MAKQVIDDSFRVNQSTGKVTVWDKALNKDVEMWAVDARERIALGAALAYPPDGTKTAPEKSETTGKVNDPAEPYNFMKHTLLELRDFAGQAGLEATDKMTKADIAAGLDRLQFRPKEND